MVPITSSRPNAGTALGSFHITSSLEGISRATLAVSAALLHELHLQNRIGFTRRTDVDDAILRLEKLVVRYGSFVAVDELDLALRPGELFGLLGPNGAGKSSTIRVLIGQRKPTGGRVLVAGLDVVRDWQ